MSNYIKTTNFAAKDSLPSGNPAKIVKGTEINTEFDNIAVASATKLNSSAVSTFGGTLIDDANASAARTTLGLGTAATTASTDYATAAQGTTADAALPRTGGAMTGAITTNSTFDGRDVATDGTKLDGIEAGATADQTAAEIKTAYESNANTNAFTDTDETKLDGIEAGADVTDTTNVVASLSAGTGISLSAGGEIANTAPDQTVALTGAGGTSISGTYPSFTITSTSFALPVATDTTLGGIELFSDTDQTVVANAVTTTAARTYGIQLNSDNQAVVNVPWTDTTYTVGDGGLTEINFTSADNTKLDGIEASADVTDTANVTAAGALMTTGGTLTGDLNFGDNDKATFGAGSDLQIYHDGYSSYISHNTTGEDLVIEATSPGDDVIIRAADDLNFRVNGNENCIVAVGGGATTLYNSNSAKLATTATGIDVTGTATMDGLTVDGTSVLDSETNFVPDSSESNKSLVLASSGATGGSGQYGASLAFSRINTESPRAAIAAVNTDGSFERMGLSFWTHIHNSASTMSKRMQIDHDGDISFYEDTGTTPKLFWDASAESLGIGTDSPSAPLAIVATANQIPALGAASSHAAIGSGGFGTMIGTKSTGVGYIQQQRFDGTATAYSLALQPNGGNVGIGTSSPSAPVTIKSNSTSGSTSGLLLQGNSNTNTIVAIGEKSTDGGRFHMYDGGVEKIAFYTDGTANHISSGNVGIGTDSPVYSLDVRGEAAIELYNTSGGGDVLNLRPSLGDANKYNMSISSYDHSGGGVGPADGISINAFDGVSIATGSSTARQERMRIDSSGNVGIGTSSPSSALDVAGTLTVQGAITEDAETLTGTATTIDLATATNFTHTLTGATTYTFSNPATTGNATAFTLKVIQDTTARTITWPASVDWAGGTAPTLTATSGGVDVFVFYTIDGGTTYYGFTAGQAMA